MSLADKVVPESDIQLKPDFTFFRKVMKYSEQRIAEVTADAIVFFKTKFGLDFSQSQPNKLGQREIEDAIFLPFQLSPNIEYSITFNKWIISERRGSICYENRDEGFAVTFKKERNLFGTYGGTQGKPVTINDIVVYGFYNIPIRSLSGRIKPLVIRYTSGSPARVEPNDGFQIINCDLFSNSLGEGTAQGVARVTPVGGGKVHFTVRNLFTFPAHPRMLYLFGA